MNENLDIQNLTDAVTQSGVSIREGMSEIGTIKAILRDITEKDEETGEYRIKEAKVCVQDQVVR